MMAERPQRPPRHMTEYGVIVDRTERGLGFYLAHVARTQKAAETRAAQLRNNDDYPVSVQRRDVVTSDWQEIGTVAAEHVGGCNTGCDGDNHLLLAAPVPHPAATDVGEGGGGRG